MATFYEINEELRDALTAQYDLIDPESGEVLDEENFALMDERIEALNLSRSEKVDAYGVVIKEFNADIEGMEKEVKQLQARIKRKRGRRDWMVKSVLMSMIAFGETRLETARNLFSLRRSERTIVTDESLLPEEYVKTIVERKPDLTAIKKAIKAAEKEGVPFEGAYIEVVQNLQIK